MHHLVPCRVIRRPSDGSVKHYVGQIMTHARYHYKGVIYGRALALPHPFLTWVSALRRHAPNSCWVSVQLQLCRKLAASVVLVHQESFPTRDLRAVRGLCSKWRAVQQGMACPVAHR